MSPVHGFTSSNTNSNGIAAGASAAAGTANARAATPSRRAKSHLIGRTSSWETRLLDPMIDPVRFRSVSDAQQTVSVRSREASQMEFRILGPLEVWDEGREVSLGGHKPRALLALLLLHRNEVVPADRLIDELWGEDSPEDAAAALGSTSRDFARRFRWTC